MNFFSSFILFLTTFVILGCAQTENDKIGEAQACLNSASTSGVNDCLNIISGLESQKSYVIRCSASFIEQGFDQPSKFVTALQGLESNTGGQGDSLLGMLGVLSFSSSSKANTAANRCEKSGSTSLIKLANLAKMATILATFSGADIASGDIPTQEQMNDALASIPGDPAAQENLGETVLSINESCQQGGDQSGANKEICDKIKSSLDDATQDNGGDTPTAAQIGSALATYLSTDH